MPRKKAADRVGPVKTRTRSGCKECRASRVRCDTKKPICTRCLEKGLTCSRELVLKWESEFVSRGLAFGRAGVWSKSRSPGETPAKLSPPSSASSTSSLSEESEWCDVPTIEPWSFVNSGVSTFEDPYQVDIACDEVNAVVVHGSGKRASRNDLLSVKTESPIPLHLAYYRSVFQHLQKPVASLSLFPSISDSSQAHLFQYYLQQVCPRTTASSKVESPFASLILPFCLSASPTLFKAIEALGACHRSRFDPTFNVMALRLKCEALRGLRNRLTTERSLMCLQDPEPLVIMMMLCLYEIVDNCDKRWTVHLTGAKEFIRFRREHQLVFSPPGNAPEPVSAFAESFFAFQDVMGRTACGEKVTFGNDFWQENDRKIDLWMGCSPELVSILFSITEMSRARRQPASDSARAAFSLQAASLEHRLETLVQEINGDYDDSLQRAAEIKRMTAVLYLHCALYGSSPTTPLVVSYVRQILRFISDMLESGSLVSMTWPIFVAAVELDPLQDELWSDSNGEDVVYGRPLVLRALAAMAESSVSNVARSRAVITKVWQSRESDLLKGSSPVDGTDQPTACNDWEWYVAPVSDAMSLA